VNSLAYNKPSQREFQSLKNTHKIPCMGRYSARAASRYDAKLVKNIHCIGESN
jgi:hypothetical protein